VSDTLESHSEQIFFPQPDLPSWVIFRHDMAYVPPRAEASFMEKKSDIPIHIKDRIETETRLGRCKIKIMINTNTPTAR
jgi:hypothetical protein